MRGPPLPTFSSRWASRPSSSSWAPAASRGNRGESQLRRSGFTERACRGAAANRKTISALAAECCSPSLGLNELGELRDELRPRFLEDLQDRAHAQFRDADFGEDLDDVVEFAVGQRDELVLREPVPVQILFELRPPASLVFH